MHKSKTILNDIWFVSINFILLSQLIFTANSHCTGDKCKQIREFRTLLAQNRIPQNCSQVYNYIEDDLYILRWLQLGAFDANTAYHYFTEHLIWRQQLSMDTIHLEDWSNFKEDYPQFLDTHDKFGRPVAELWLADWDFRRAYVAGQRTSLIRWMVYLMEMAQRRLYEIRRETGLKNITGVVELLDIEGFNSVRHSCAVCIPFLMKYQRYSKEQYPGIWTKNYMVNAGPLYRAVLVLTSKAVNYGSNDILKVFSGRREWLPVIEKEISRDQRSPRFGGTLERRKKDI